MKKLKLNFFNKIELFILGFDHKKISRWLNNKNVLNSKKDKILREEWEKIGVEFKKQTRLLNSIRKEIKINYKDEEEKKEHSLEIRKIRKKFDKISLKTIKLKKEIHKGSIIFDSFLKFSLFTIWLQINFFGTFGVRNIMHERQHAKIYIKNNIRPKYGWQKFFDNERRDYGFHPFIFTRASRKIHLKALKVPKNPSLGDKFDLELYKRYK